MGVEIEFEKLAGHSETLHQALPARGKIVITATQMLESMIQNPLPTRAEITDVANAVFDGSSAVMLSGESAVGAYPVEAVAAMAKIAAQAELDDPHYLPGSAMHHEMDAEDTTNAVGHAACTLAKDIKAAALIAITKSGYTASRMSKFRPSTPIIAVTPHHKTYTDGACLGCRTIDGGESAECSMYWSIAVLRRQKKKICCTAATRSSSAPAYRWTLRAIPT